MTTSISTFNKWRCTDPDNNQYILPISDNSFLFKEDRISNPATGTTYVYESLIDLSAYTQKEMFESVQCFGYSFNEMCTWLEEGVNLDLIAECIFEMES